jgi:catechol 2,3-dioxygenase-like lactoylglutathione lyase family enzyme
MQVSGLLESALYGTDLAALERFYVEVFGLAPIARTEGCNVVLRCGHAALILFNPEATSRPGRMFPPHGGDQPGHIAFVVPGPEIPTWRARLATHGVEIETEVGWPDGGCSLYVRDPAGNSVELAPPTLWGGLGQGMVEEGCAGAGAR